MLIAIPEGVGLIALAQHFRELAIRLEDVAQADTPMLAELRRARILHCAICGSGGVPGNRPPKELRRYCPQCGPLELAEQLRAQVLQGKR
jgi:hypothetical protein